MIDNILEFEIKHKIISMRDQMHNIIKNMFICIILFTAKKISMLLCIQINIIINSD